MNKKITILLSLLSLGCSDDQNESATETPEFCGDLRVASYEECDDETDDCENCILSRKIFVTSLEVDGLFVSSFKTKCYDDAFDAGLYRGLDWTPWISYNNKDAKTLEFQSPFKYERIDGILVANSFQQLIDGDIENPINIDQNGDLIDEERVWTGTNELGKYSGFNCLEWTDNNERILGTYGWTNHIDYRWSSADEANCIEKLHVYCIEDEKL